MTRYNDGTFRLSTAEWLKLMGILFVHSAMVFSGLLFWVNRIVAVEVRVTNIESTLSNGLNEVRADIKEILRRTNK
jgi:hypothetical protein